MMLSSPSPNLVSSFTIPETPRTESSSQMNALMTTPKKYKSPNSQMMEDVTMSMDSAQLSTPVKDSRLLGVQKRK